MGALGWGQTSLFGFLFFLVHPQQIMKSLGFSNRGCLKFFFEGQITGAGEEGGGLVLCEIWGMLQIFSSTQQKILE